MSRGSHASSADSSFASAQALDARVCSEVGARLGASRRGRGWTVADVANRLLLSTAQVTGLERADASAFHNPAFFGAGLRKYATLMAIDCPEAILTSKSSSNTEPEDPRRALRDEPDRESTGDAKRDSRAPRSFPMEWLAAAAIVVLTGAGLAMYFGGRTPPPVAVAAESPATLSLADVKPPRQEIPPPEPLRDAQPPESLPTTEASADTPVPTDLPAPSSPTPASQGSAGVVTLSHPAWVFVRYGDNSVVQRTLQAGQSLALTSAPIYLAIGAGEGVTLTIRERPIDVSPFRNGNEIRIGASDLATLAR